MRTAQVLKHWVSGITLLGIIVSWSYGGLLAARVGGILLSLTGGLFLRLAANVGQLLYDIKAELITGQNALSRQLEGLRERLQVSQDVLSETLRVSHGTLGGRLNDLGVAIQTSQGVLQQKLIEVREAIRNMQETIEVLQKISSGREPKDLGDQNLARLETVLQRLQQLREEFDRLPTSSHPSELHPRA